MVDKDKDHMDDSKGIATVIIISGVMLTVFGIILLTAGKLPGDIVLKRDNFTFFFPIVTSIILSLILTLIFTVLGRR